VTEAPATLRTRRIEALPEIESRRWLPPRHVVLAFVVSRSALVLVALAVGFLRGGESGLSPLLHWDFVWYSEISAHGFGVTRDGGQTGWPFFPVLPVVLWLGRYFGLPTGLVGLLAVHAGFFLALWGIHHLTRRHFGEPTADLAVWGAALFPASASFSLVYPDPLAMAASVWAFAAVEQFKDGAASGLGAVATLLRPNGIITSIALAWSVRSWRRATAILLPSVLALVGWMALLWHWSGDPLQWVHAKTAWDEVTLRAAIVNPSAHLQWPELVLLAVGAALVIGCRRHLARGWALLYALAILPSLATGMTGLARYSSACFVPAVCAGVVLRRLPRWARIVALGLCAGSLVVVAVLMYTENWTP